MPDAIDTRIQAALREEVAALPFVLTPGMVEERLDRHPGTLRMVAVAAVGVLVAAALIAAALGAGRPNMGPPGPTTASPSPGAVLGGGRALTWAEVPFGTVAARDPVALFTDDGFVLYSASDGALLATSTDGAYWQPVPGTWVSLMAGVESGAGSILTWSDSRRGEVAVFRRSDGSINRQSLGAPIDDAAIGPLGIVALSATAGGGWYSKEGASWIPFADPPNGGRLVRVAATASGFFARSADGRMWRSNDGRTWVAIGAWLSPGCEGPAIPATCDADVVPWRDGVLVVNVRAARYEYWTSAGVQDLAPGLPTSADALVDPVTGTGRLGIVTVDPGANRFLFSPDGSTWSQATLPAPADGSLTLATSHETSVAVGDDAVLVVLWESSLDGSAATASLWRGTLAP